jgi:NADH:ubiquinone oxidoreductase subunit C
MRNSYIANFLLQSAPIHSFDLRLGQPHFSVGREVLPKIGELLKGHSFGRYSLVDLTALHLSNYFEVIYNFVSVNYNQRLFLRVRADEAQPLPSLVSIFNAANWLEREVWDMFGIYFFNHQDLRRLLTDYGFTGHPLRKDFPVSGYMELFYNDKLKKLQYQHLELSQEFRVFEFNSPWMPLKRNAKT